MKYKKKYIFFFILKKKKKYNVYFKINYIIKKKHFNKLKEIDLILKYILNKNFIKKNIIKTVKLLLIFFLKKKKNILKIKNNILKIFIKNIFKKKIIFNFKNFYLFKNFFIFFKNINLFLLNNNKISKKYSFLINYLFNLKNIIKNYIIKNYIIILEKKLSKKKKKKFKELYQENIFNLKKLLNNYNYYYKKNFLLICYWFVIKNIKNNNKLINNENFNLKKNNNLKKTINENIFKENDDFFLKKIILELLSSFSIKEQKIIKLRFGFGVFRVYTLEEIGELFSLTRERIRQLELKIILKIKNSYRSEVLKPYIKLLKKKY
ncbi:putative RNA polymerase sigma factor rpoD [Candidatus Carsonella ruddii CS isolate Thao2000]|uniref:Putative RNA polymerase sigma factor rpoD n=1 Tax=Candidatus Carsonella ruddii CS isolate Thao2000 TaxID=1202537 RepID=J7GWC1_CARRU|nr:sigma factor-like helix-turn-helix DNA-binding protein [Candidatus Carsonella ruddii]AFP83731.1 putative RNA polymerase sigma factor rpoD [Candidatus Carsonella ruddii CS isolate Thao2000]